MQLPQFLVSAGKLRQAWMVHLERNTTSPGTGPTQIRQEFPEPFLIVLVQQHAVRFRPPDNLGETLFGDRFEDQAEHQLVLAIRDLKLLVDPLGLHSLKREGQKNHVGIGNPAADCELPVLAQLNRAFVIPARMSGLVQI